MGRKHGTLYAFAVNSGSHFLHFVLDCGNPVIPEVSVLERPDGHVFFPSRQSHEKPLGQLSMQLNLRWGFALQCYEKQLPKILELWCTSTP